MVQFHDRVWGPDVSSWQGTVDWTAVKRDGASFGITKISEGTEYLNPYARENWDGMREQGLVRVQYHYGRPAILSASEEAAFFVQRMLPLEAGDIIALDLETDSRDGPFKWGAYWADNWLDIVQKSVGFRPMLYSNAGILQAPGQGFGDIPDLGKSTGLWLANWNEVFPSAVPPWQTVALWQFTNQGNVPGIAGQVDLNIFNGTLEQMRKYGMPEGKPDTGGNLDTGNLRKRVDDLFVRLGAVDESIRQLLDDAHTLMNGWKNG